MPRAYTGDIEAYDNKALDPNNFEVDIYIALNNYVTIMQYWLMKSEPDVFSIDDLIRSPNKTSPWEGVRNYQVRNMLRDQMHVGDLAFFYHSSCQTPGIAGIVEIVKQGYPDPTAFIPSSPYYDANSKPEQPRWYMVDVRFRHKMQSVISLQQLRAQVKLQDMISLRKGNRLSITPVSAKQWELILQMDQKGG